MNFGLEVRTFGSSLGSVSNCNSYHLSVGCCVRYWAKCFSYIISFDPFHISILISILIDVKVDTQRG